MTKSSEVNMSSFSEAQPLVSILIPAYNHERFIKEVLDSYLSITYANFELLIIDDGSTDSTPQLITTWIEKHKNLINVKYHSRKNQGCSATLNELIKMAKGEFIVPSASDDYLLPSSIEKLVMLAKIFPEKLYYFGDGIVIDDRGKKIKNSILAELNKAIKRNYHTPEALAEELISRWSFGGPLGMFRSEFFRETYMYDEKLVIQDWDLYLKLVAENKAIFIDIPVCAYRVHSSSTCRTGNVENHIKNLQDQCLVAHRNQPLFQGHLRNLLKKEELLLKAKIFFLKRDPIRFFMSLSYYFLFTFYTSLRKLYETFSQSGALIRSSKRLEAFLVFLSRKS